MSDGDRKGERGGSSDTALRPPYLHAAGAAASAFALYVATLAPTTWFWDTSEYIATAHILGIPHPPGNPLFVAVAKVWSLLLAPTGLSMAVRVNLLAAFTSAAATGFFFLVTHRVLVGWASRSAGEGAAEAGPRGVPWTRLVPLLGAWAGAVLGATAFTVWNQSNVNEKVYTLSVLVIAVVSWLAIRWMDRKNETGSAWLLVLAVYLMVLGTTNHLMSLLPAPALLALVLTERPRILLDRRVMGRAVAAVVVGLSFNFFLPIRAAEQPTINEGEPTCESVLGAAAAVYTQGRAGCPALAANLSREQYAKPSIFTDPTAMTDPAPPRGIGILTHQFMNYFQYFDWQWARGLAVSPVPGNARLPFTLVFLGLGIWGIFVARRSSQGHLAYLGVLALTLTFGLVYYLNFRYGYSLDPDLPGSASREVRERDYFFVASFHLWGFLSGLGLMAAWRWAAGGSFNTRHLAFASPVVLLALVPLALNWSWASRSGDFSARDWAYDMLQSVEPYGILFTNGDNDTFPLWYLQEVEEIRPDVTVIVTQYLYTQWYPRQLVYHTEPERQRPFSDPEGLNLYDEPEAPPARAITTLSDQEMNRVGFAILPEDVTLTIGDQPILYPAGYEFTRADQLALAIIQDSIGERPIYFASTAGQAGALGLGRFTVRQGLAAKLVFEDLEEIPGLVQLSETMGGEWIDVDRSLTLMQDVFRYRGLLNRDIWVDRATLNIPWHFYYLSLQLADAVSQMDGDPAVVDQLLEWADGFLVTAQGGEEAVRSRPTEAAL